MVEQIIYLEPEDDAVSIRDRLERVEAGRALVVLPRDGDPISDRLGLVLLQRQGDRLGIEIGLVTARPGIAAEARDLGFPVFPTAEMGQNRLWRWPWRPARRPVPVQRARPPDQGDLREVRRRSRRRPVWQSWLGRFQGVVLFALALVALGVGVLYVVPGATVAIAPATQEISVTGMAVGEPGLETADYEGGRVPARVIRVEVARRGTASTSGFTDVPDAPAAGNVVFINQQASPVTVPAGTYVRTSAGTTIRFRTTRAVQVPGATGATVEAPVVALDPGPWGNVGANLINQIEGALALQLNVRNLAPTTGGGVRQARAVTQADLDRLRGQVLQQLFQMAKADMANWMTESEFLAQESLSLFLVLEEDYDRYVGERADSVELNMTALIQGSVVDDSEGYGVVYTRLAAETPPGYRLLPDSIATRRGDVLMVDDDGRVTFLMQGRARVAAEVDQTYIAEMIRGQRIADAVAWIAHQVPVQREPSIQVWPAGFDRLPHLPIRINVRIEMPE